MADYLFLGALTRDFILPPNGQPLLDVPGGGAVYDAAGAALWGGRAGIVARVGEDFPRKWLQAFTRHGWETQGVKILPQPLDVRRVLIYDNAGRLTAEQPIAAFTARGFPFPKSLLNYTPQLWSASESPTPRTLRLNDLPPAFAEARAAHFSPYDYLTHQLLPAAFRAAGVPFITLEPHPAYMTPFLAEKIPALMSGLSALIVPESTLRALFQEQLSDLWEMAARLAQWQVENIIIRRPHGEVWIYEGNGRRWIVPGYPIRLADPTGAGDAFAGAFLVAYRNTLDVVTAAVRGAATAALAAETRGVFALAETLPALLQARTEMLARSVHPA